jgi:hypothetical protein
MWYGPYPDAVLSKGASGITPIGTICDANGACKLDPITLMQEWIRLFVLKNSTADTTHLSLADYENIFDAAAQEYDSLIGTDDPDLSAFRRSGGKMITYHGLVRPFSQLPPSHCLAEHSLTTWLSIRRTPLSLPVGLRTTTSESRHSTPKSTTSTASSLHPAWGTATEVPALSPTPPSTRWSGGSKKA